MNTQRTLEQSLKDSKTAIIIYQNIIDKLTIKLETKDEEIKNMENQIKSLLNELNLTKQQPIITKPTLTICTDIEEIEINVIKNINKPTISDIIPAPHTISDDIQYNLSNICYKCDITQIQPSQIEIKSQFNSIVEKFGTIQDIFTHDYNLYLVDDNNCYNITKSNNLEVELYQSEEINQASR